MAWPLNQDYNEAIQEPRSCLADPELREGEVVCNAMGLPRPYSGNFADVYEVRCPGGGRYAVKCFTREVRGLQHRYQAISAHLRQAKLPFAVDFTYLEKGIQVRGQWYPILKMQWVEGFTLNDFVRDNLDRPATLDGLLQIWARMAKRLREARLAHADLQHGNVLLVPGSTASSLAVKLIDYDGMFVPALAGNKSGEVGHPAYQHPQRLREGTYSPEVDRFPLLVVAAALRCLIAGGRDLWERYDTGDNLLFREADLRNPGQSVLFTELRGLKDPAAVELVQHLAGAAYRPLEQVPLLEKLLPEKKAAFVRGKQDVPAQPSPPTSIQGQPSVAQTAAVDAWGGMEPTDRTGRLRKRRPGGILRRVLLGGSVAVLALVGLLLWNRTPTTPVNTPTVPVAQAGSQDKKPVIVALPGDRDKNDKQPEPRPQPDPREDKKPLPIPLPRDPENPPGRQNNLALNKPATASSSQRLDRFPDKANDGDEKSRWCASSGATPAWWEVDLGKPEEVTGCRIVWEHSDCWYQYKVEGSADGQTWILLVDQTRNEVKDNIHVRKFHAKDVRHVRITITGVEPLQRPRWPSFYEFEVHGTQISRPEVNREPRPEPQPRPEPNQPAAEDDYQLIRVMKFQDFARIESQFPSTNNRAQQGTATASSTEPGESMPDVVFKGHRFAMRPTWCLTRHAAGWFDAKWDPGVEGRYIVVFGRATAPGNDPWGKAVAKINGDTEIPIENMSGSHVILIDFKSPRKIHSLRLEMNGKHYHAGINGIEIHP
jgi:hypothetical protein